MSLADLKAIWGKRCPPVLLYFHENQFAYPLAPGEARDYQYGFTDITSALAADRILFNSQTHFWTFFDTLPQFLKMMPEYAPTWVIDTIRAKSSIAYPGCHFDGTASTPFPDRDRNRPPVIIWNHRWEFDKNPEDFFDALEAVDEMGLAFDLVLLGERYRRVPQVFSRALSHFQNHIIHCGFEASKARYRGWLQKGSFVISTARQENFGMSVVEAVRYGCLPLLPNRLVYPEIITEEFHTKVLFANHQDLIEKLAAGLRDNTQDGDLRQRLSAAMSQFAWERCIGNYDDKLDELVAIKN